MQKLSTYENSTVSSNETDSPLNQETTYPEPEEAKVEMLDSAARVSGKDKIP